MFQVAPVLLVSLLIVHSTDLLLLLLLLYRGADKSFARPGRKQANVYVRMA